MTQECLQAPVRHEGGGRPPSQGTPSLGTREALYTHQAGEEGTECELPMSVALRAALHRRDDDFHGRRESAHERETRLRRGDPALGLVLRTPKPTRYPASVIAEAERLLGELERGFTPMPKARLRHEIDRFLDVLNASVANPQDSDALVMRKSALMLALHNAPILLWTQNLLRRAQRHFLFFPSVAALSELFDAHLDAKRRQMASLRHLVRQNATAHATCGTGADQKTFQQDWRQPRHRLQERP